VGLQHLDLVAVGILHKEEPRHHPAVAVEFLYRQRADAEIVEPFVLAIEIGDRESDMAIARAQLIGLGPAMVPG